MKPWTRWQDWLNGLAGFWLAASPWILGTTDNRAIFWTATTGGVLAIAAALWALAMPASKAAEWTTVALGVLIFASPYVLSYAAVTAAIWDACIVGALLVGLGFWNMPEVNHAILVEEAHKKPRAM